MNSTSRPVRRIIELWADSNLTPERRTNCGFATISINAIFFETIEQTSPVIQEDTLTTLVSTQPIGCGSQTAQCLLIFSEQHREQVGDSGLISDQYDRATLTSGSTQAVTFSVSQPQALWLLFFLVLARLALLPDHQHHQLHRRNLSYYGDCSKEELPKLRTSAWQ
jgi:hypothetical protein